jgi:hypothetical protein
MLVENAVERTFHACPPSRRLYCDPRRHTADPCKGYARVLAKQARNMSVVCGQISTVVVAMLAYERAIGGIIDCLQAVGRRKPIGRCPIRGR